MTSATETSIPSSQGDLFSLLDADNIETVEETKALIHENLHSSRDPGLLHAMVEYYLKTRSPACLQILSGVHEARAQVSYKLIWSIGCKTILIIINRLFSVASFSYLGRDLLL